MGQLIQFYSLLVKRLPNGSKRGKKFILYPIFFVLNIADGDDEPPPEPAPPEVPPRGFSSSSSNMLNQTLKKRPADFVVTIDKNGDQKHEEYVPSNQQGMWNLFSFLFPFL